MPNNYVGLQSHKFLRTRPRATLITAAPAKVDPDINSLPPAKLLQLVAQRRDASLRFRVVFLERHQHAHAPYPVDLLRTCAKRPCCRSAANEHNKLPPLHSITSSAARSSPSGMVRPSALAVLRLITNSNLVGSITGKSLGLAPRRIRPA